MITSICTPTSAMIRSAKPERRGSIFPKNSELIGIDAQHRIAVLDSFEPPGTSMFAPTLTVPPSKMREPLMTCTTATIARA
jgi:hypothetical protein